jgi:hypothetical protein
MNMKDLKHVSKKLFSSIYFKRLIPIFIILGVVCLFFWKSIFKGLIPLPGDFVLGIYYPWLDYKWGFPAGVPVKNPITADVVSLIFPEQMLSVGMLKDGVFPLWNSRILTGTPLLANLQAAPFSPTNFLYFIFDTLTGWSIQIILQHILACLFMYVLLRHWRLSRTSSMFGAFVFSFSGFNLIFSQWNGHTLTSAFIPIILFFEDRLLLRGKLTDGVGMSLCLLLQLLSGYPQTSFYTVISVVILYLVRGYRKNIFVKQSFLIIAFGLLSLGLSALQLFPTAELWSVSQRNVEPISYEASVLPIKKFITVIAPDFFGNHATGNYWGPQDYTSNTLFVGVVAFTFCVYSLTLLNNKSSNNDLSQEMRFLIFLSLLSFVLIFSTPISYLLWHNNVFGFQAVVASRATILTNFTMAALSAIGINAFMKNVKKQKNLFLLPTFFLLGIFAYFAYTIKGAGVNKINAFSVAIRNLFVPGVVYFSMLAVVVLARRRMIRKIVIYLLLTLSMTEVYFVWNKYTPFFAKNMIFPTTPVLEFLQKQERPFRVTGNSVVPINLLTPYGLDTLEGYETIHPYKISRFLGVMNSGRLDAKPMGRYAIVDNDTSRLLDLMNTRYHLVEKVDVAGNPSENGSIPKEFNNEGYQVAFSDKTVAVMESKLAQKRAFMVYDWETLEDEDVVLDRLLDKNFPVFEKIIVSKQTTIEPSTPSTNKVTYTSYNNNNYSLQVETKTAGLLFISDAVYPGWKVYVDGKKEHIFTADYMFRAIEIPEGKHSVRFVYYPNSFKIGLIISGLSAFLLVSLFIYERRKTGIGNNHELQRPKTS